ncbi:MAG TPA: prepilin peptidase [Alphaproteobacteria bacterium]|jgi:prepilin peptidase CpaA|nr:prepilin peptidase [Alphaproteobacteria bacterium]
MDAAFQNAALAGFAFCLLWAAARDARGYVIPNRAIVATIALFPIYLLTRAIATGSMISAVGDGAVGLSLAALVLIAGLAMFSLHLIGGGDAKLASAVALWAGADNVVAFLIIASISGGVLAAAVLIWRAAFPQLESAPSLQTFGVRLRQGLKAPVPFGVAIAIGGLYIVTRLAAL